MNDNMIYKFYNDLWDNTPMGRIGCGCPVILTLLLVVLLMCSCATKTKTEYINRDVIRYETKILHDTLIQNTYDSVYESLLQKGDTIYRTKYVEKTKWRDRVIYQRDTMYRDSIQVRTKETMVEKKIIPKWCCYSLTVCILFIIFAIVKLVRWIQWH